MLKFKSPKKWRPAVTKIVSQKQKYKTLNWSQYNKNLVKRGDIRLFISKEKLTSWFAPRRGKNCRPRVYSNDTILLALTILVLYRLNYRSAEGFLTALLAMMKIDLPVPDYTTLCRRMKSLSVGYRRYLIQKKGQPLDLVFDATGLKVYSRGEWKTKPSDRFNVKNWKMLHLGMSPDNFQIRELEFSSCKEQKPAAAKGNTQHLRGYLCPATVTSAI